MKLTSWLSHKTSLHYRPDIDGLRAVAILLVIFFHAIPEAVPAGFIGVDIFFVISGYLITGILLKDMESGHFSYLHFYARRFRRIIPALILVLISILLLGWLFLLSNEYSNVARNVVAGATFTTNLILLRQAGYFDWSAEFNPLLHLWSLGIEEQFYLLWPPILLFIYRRSRRLAIWTLLLLVLSFGLNAYFVPEYESKVFYLLPTRFWELLAGCVLAITEASGKVASRRFGNTKSIAGAAILGAAIYYINKGEHYPGWWALMPTISALLLISAGPRALLNRTFLSSKPVVLVGLVSYPLYLWHWPLLSIARIVEGKLSNAFALGILGLSVMLAILTWQFIELPAQLKLFQRYHKAQRDKYYVAVALALIFVVSSFGLLVVYHDGFPGRYPKYESALKQLDQLSFEDTLKAADCKNAYGLQQAVCSQSGPNPTIAIIGDSHAMQLFPGVSLIANQRGQNVILLAMGACPPLYGINTTEFGRDDNNSCILTADDYIRFFSSPSDTVKTVIIASRGASYISGHDMGDGRLRWNLVSLQAQEKAASRHALFLAGTSRMIDFLEARGKRVIFFIDNPELGFDPKSCMIQRPLSLLHKAQRSCYIPAPAVQAWQEEYRKVVAELKSLHPNLQIFDSTAYWCNQQDCFISKDGKLLYRDDNHLNLYGSRFIAEKFFAWQGMAGHHATDAAKGNRQQFPHESPKNLRRLDSGR